MVAKLWLLCLVLAQGPGAQAPPDEKINSTAIIAAIENSVSDAIDNANDSVVAISRIKNHEGTETNAIKGKAVPVNPEFRPMAGFFDPTSADFQSFDYGSGVVIGNDGQILTAFHVVQGADSILVRAAGRQEFFAEIIAADPRSDLAVIVPKSSMESPTPTPKLKPIKIGNSDQLRRGSFLVALGNPFNSAKDGQPSAAFGILSNRARKLDLSLDDAVGGRQLRHLPTLLQLDSKLNLGMSGGAVVNMRGQLVGLTTSGGNPQGFDAQAGYAIPMDALSRRAIDTLMRGEEVEYGFLGVSLSASGDNIINGVSPGTPAAKAGLNRLDQIIKVGDFDIKDGDGLVLAINALPVETPTKITVRRINQELVRDLRLAKFPVTGEVIATNKPDPWRGIEVDWPSVAIQGNLNQELPVLRTGVTESDGALVTHVSPDSPAAGLLKPGSLILSVNGVRVFTPREFRDVAAKLKGQVKITTNASEIEIPE